jgi:2-oxoglutarate dehydrogenase E1 component
MVQAPIFHVNGDDPEAVVFLTRLAMDYRMAFNKDVVIDLICYRRHGHNEADEPAATQPVMYRQISKQVKTQALYAQKLVEEGVIGPEEGEVMLQQYRAALKTKDVVSRPVSLEFKNVVDWRPYIGTHWTHECDTTITQSDIERLMESLTTLPEGFKLNRSVAKLIDARRKMGQGELALDWGAAETLAYAALLEKGHPVRLSGQDCGRGTFAHRHAVLHEANTGETYLPLRNLSDDQANFLVINSLLSEEAVLGFEFGFSSSDPHTLVIWEAQFGDFANGAQVVMDQFISSSEAKWGRYSGLVMLLPHGYDGQGPEHSSARLERYLQLCAEDNMQVCNPTTPAQCFHMLRRQVLRPYRKPLIVMSPKSLLRHKRAVSHFNEFTDEGFKVVIDEIDPNIVPEKVNRLLFCSGKVYYDLVEAREEHGIDDIAIIRLEQLYPYPKQAITDILARYPHVKSRVWVQEEPRNQGAWWYMRAHMDVNLSHEEGRIEYAGRPASASPAVGSLQMHRQQLQDFLNEALQLEERGAQRRTA